jgi:ribosome maturation factor RimP
VDAEALVKPVVEGAGLELVDVSWSGQGRRPLLRITIDRAGGVDLDTISVVSEKVSRRLDLEGFEPGPYQLEVTTPGLERPLWRPQDFRRAVGQRIRVRTEDGTVEGELRGADDEVLRIAAPEGGERPVRLADVAAARTVVDWDEELRRGGR